MSHEFQVEGAHEAEGDLVALAVAVGVLVPEGGEHVFQFLQGGGHLQMQRIQPFGIDPHIILRRHGGQIGKRGHAAVGQGDGLQDIRVLLDQRPKVGAVCLKIGKQIDQHALLPQPDAVLSGQAGLEEHVGQARVPGLEGALDRRPVLR